MPPKTVEDIYKKMTQHEHILSRPDMYIGTINRENEEMWIVSDNEGEKPFMTIKECTWIPGLFKIFDEILVNAADNKVRDQSQSYIKVTIDTHEGMVRVKNDGEGIPIKMHKEHKMYIPEMIFGHLLTSSNYDDSEKKVTGGRNGYGAKLTNVFSKRFELETIHNGKRFRKKWTNNMQDHEKEEIDSTDKADSTQITFYPDFSKFGLTNFHDDDIVHLMKRRVYDMAACTGLTCYLNKSKLHVKSFGDYVDMYPTVDEVQQKSKSAAKQAVSTFRIGERWEVCLRISNMQYRQVTFVNSINTFRGGTHEKAVVDQVVRAVKEKCLAGPKDKKMEVQPAQIKPHLWIFVNCLIENPSFESQTKDALVTPQASFGSKCPIPKEILENFIKHTSIMERVKEMASSKYAKALSKSTSTAPAGTVNVAKLVDAGNAGTQYSDRCTLILTEGDSAKALCMAGISKEDKAVMGVYPLRGKVLNVRDAGTQKITTCKEIQDIVKCMGLSLEEKNPTRLRYGHLMIMTDQDYDGSHIKGLILNFIHRFWPELFKRPGFLQEFITPIVKVRKGGRDPQCIAFYSMPDYLRWKAVLSREDVKKWTIKYYKGLGTSSEEEAKDYFDDISRHRLNFSYRDDSDDTAMIKAFSKDKIEARKQWITSFKATQDTQATLDYTQVNVRYRDFVDKELILFSVADCERSIPSIVDGMKPGQRKILFACFLRNLTDEIKVAQLSGYVSEKACYHHGEAALIQTIVGMAQDFVGANNAPLLQKCGMFGTRTEGGKDAAAGRYIFTHLTKIARSIFHKADDYIVEYKDDDGQPVEPHYYVPVIPMVLVNGCSGIGTGFATAIPNYNPLDVIANLRSLIAGEDVTHMKPFYRGFKGEITEKEPNKFVTRGVMTFDGRNTVVVHDLPINTWTSKFQSFLDEFVQHNLMAYNNQSTDTDISFTIVLSDQLLEIWGRDLEVLEERLGLRTYVFATNIIAFSQEGQLTKYNTPEAVLKEFYLIRLDFYKKRYDYIMEDMLMNCEKTANIVRFIREVVNGELVVTRRKKKELLEELVSKGYKAFPPQQKRKFASTAVKDFEDEDGKKKKGDDNDDDDEANESPEVIRATRDYDYLLGMKLWNLTEESIEKHNKTHKKWLEDIERHKCRHPTDLWKEDLDILEKNIHELFNAKTQEKRRKQTKHQQRDMSKIKLKPSAKKDSLEFIKKLQVKSEKGKEKIRVKSEAPDEFGELLAGGDVSAVKKEKPTKPQKKKKKKKPSNEDEFDDDDFFSSSGGEDSSDSDSDDSDGGAKKKKRAPAAKKAPRKPAAKKTTSQEPPAKKHRVDAAMKTEGDEEDDFLKEFGLGAMGSATPTPGKQQQRGGIGASVTPAQTMVTKMTNFLDGDDDDKPLFQTAAASSTPATKNPPNKTNRSASSPKPKKSAAKKSTAKKRKRDDDSDEISEESSDYSSGSSSESESSSDDDDEDSDESFDWE